MSPKSAAAHWKLSIPTVFQHYFHQLWIVTDAFFPKCTFLYPCFPQVVPKSADMKILTLHNFTGKSTQRQAAVVPNICLGAAWSGCDTSLRQNLSCRCVSVRVEKKFSSVLQRFNWSQSECGTLSQYVGHETRDGDAVQSHKKSWTNDFWIFSRKNEFILSPKVAITEQKNILWFTNGWEPLLFCQWR